MVDLSSSFSVATFTRPAIIAVQWITGVWSWDIQISREPGGGWLNNLPTSNFWRLSGRDMNDDHCLDGWVMLNSWIMNLLQSVYRYWGIFSGNPTKVTKILEALKKEYQFTKMFHITKRFTMVFSDPQRSPGPLLHLCRDDVLGILRSPGGPGKSGKWWVIYHRCNILSNPFFFLIHCLIGRTHSFLHIYI